MFNDEELEPCDDTEVLDDEFIESLEFKFRIKVDGYGANTIKIRPVKEGDAYIWKYTSDYYYMEDGDSLGYTIEEIDESKADQRLMKLMLNKYKSLKDDPQAKARPKHSQPN